MKRKIDYAKDSESKEQGHELHCWIHDTQFSQRTPFTCNCSSKEIYRKEFSKRHPIKISIKDNRTENK